MKVKQVLSCLRKPGKVFAQVQITPDDLIVVQLNKVDFEFRLRQWPKNQEIFVEVNDEGDLIVN